MFNIKSKKKKTELHAILWAIEKNVAFSMNHIFFVQIEEKEGEGKKSAGKRSKEEM